MTPHPASPRYLPHSRTCFVCGEENPHGLGVRFELQGDEVVARFAAGRQHTGYHGMVHGGVLCSLLDETLGWAPSVRDGRFSVCAELTVRFLRPAPPETPLTVRGRATRAQGRLFLAEGEVTDAKGTVYARASGKYSPLTREQTLEVVDQLLFWPDTVPARELWPEG